MDYLGGNSPAGMEEPKGNSGGGFLSAAKNFLVFLVLIFIVTASFWVSFQLGKRILVPVRKLSARPVIKAEIPEPPPSIRALQELEKAMSAEAAKDKKTTEIKVAAVPPRIAPKPKVVARVVRAVGRYYKVQAGLFADKDEAQEIAAKVSANGFDIYLKKVSSGWRVQVGAFRTKKEAESLQNNLSGKGFKAEVVYE